MKYYSLNNTAQQVSFREAVTVGLAPDKGLFFPEHIPFLGEAFFKTMASKSDVEIAFEAIRSLVLPEIPEDILYTIVEETLDFDFPIITLDKDFSILELFHGPTMAFKDVGARFMARCLGYFNQNNANNVTVLVATSGDTGGAVADGFLGVQGIRVVILYPKGKVSDIQEKQLTTLGQNIHALEVNGTFDDCQAIVKQAFIDEDLKAKIQLTSANSINVARWLPQMFYYLIACKNLGHKYDKLVFSVPSGNFGNICAGMVAQKMGMPVQHFIASCNANDTVSTYMKTTQYKPKPSVQTISNAMDVGNPSNFVRIQELYEKTFATLASNLSVHSFTDEETKSALQELYAQYKYVADPHGAVGYLGAKKYKKSHNDPHVVILETAHPAKFSSVVEHTLGLSIKLPEQLEKVKNKPKIATEVSSYQEVKAFLCK